MRLIDGDALMRKFKTASPMTVNGRARQMVEDMPTIEPKRGKWEEKHHAYADEEKVIEEWQSCRCSVCGRYDTRPYMYYFDEPHFCSWCGADMRGEEHETD